MPMTVRLGSTFRSARRCIPSPASSSLSRARTTSAMCCVAGCRVVVPYGTTRPLADAHIGGMTDSFRLECCRHGATIARRLCRKWPLSAGRFRGRFIGATATCTAYGTMSGGKNAASALEMAVEHLAIGRDYRLADRRGTAMGRTIITVCPDSTGCPCSTHICSTRQSDSTESASA